MPTALVTENSCRPQCPRIPCPGWVPSQDTGTQHLLVLTWAPCTPSSSREWVKNPLAGTIVSDTMGKEEDAGAEIPSAPTGQMDRAGQTDMTEVVHGLTLSGAA